MSLSPETHKILEQIESPDIQQSAIKAAILMRSTNDVDFIRAARQTFVALVRFGTAYKDYEETARTRSRNLLDARSVEGHDLKEIINRSGINYFGGMFQSDGEHTPLMEREVVMGRLARGGFETSPLDSLNDDQLDLFYTKTLESGLIFHSANKPES